MTLATGHDATPSQTAPIHPLAPLTSAEVDRMRETLIAAGFVDEHTRFAYAALREPPRELVLAGSPVPRRAEVLLVGLDHPRADDFVVDLDAGTIDERTTYTLPADGTGPVFDDEYIWAEEIVKADPGWRAAVERRGLTDLDKVRVVALSPGVFGYADEEGVRTLRAVAYVQEYPTDSAWAHPVGGVVAHVDMTNRRVLRVIETQVEHVPEESGDYLDPAVRGPERTTLRPISITQPEGVSFTLEDGLLRWENWELRIGYNGREGLTLHQVGYREGDRLRPVLYRASVAEMIVNYGDPSPVNAWQNYFDVGEYQFGRFANSLELGCDCLGEIVYADAVVVDDHGCPKTIRNAICIHEEDYGILWKHADVFSGSNETRRQRRLVVSSFLTVGNYDYGFYWHLYLDGAIELEVKATGIVFTTGHPGGDYAHSAEVAPGLGAPIHQHLFCARLDMMVDGADNTVDELEFVTDPIDASNPWGNAFRRRATRLRTEAEGVRDADPARGRVWRIASATRQNRMGGSTGYVLHPEGKPTLLAAEESSATARGAFATHHLWVTQRDEHERWPAGRLVNQHPGGNGLPSYAAADRSIDGEAIVVWHTFGLTHFARLEDYPIMPVDYAGFRLTPDGFFDRNPTLDVPAPVGHCTRTSSAPSTALGQR